MSWKSRASRRTELPSPFANRQSCDGANSLQANGGDSGITSSKAAPGGNRVTEGSYQ